MTNNESSLTLIHLSVFLFGLAGIFAKLIHLDPIIIVLGRVLFATIFLAVLLFVFKESIRLKLKKDYLILALCGIILAFHWITFFKAIQMSSVAIGLLSYSTFPMFTAFLEPLFFNQKLQFSNILLAALTMLGIAFVIPEYSLESQMTFGVIWGILSGLSFSVLSIINKKYTQSYSPIVISFHQDFWAMVVLAPFLFILSPSIQLTDFLYLALLGIVFTGIAHTLFIKGLTNVNVQTASIISSLEPLYGIVFAIFLVNEIPTIQTLMGGIIIIGASIYASASSEV